MRTEAGLRSLASRRGTKYPCVSDRHRLSWLFRCEPPLCLHANVKDDAECLSELPPKPSRGVADYLHLETPKKRAFSSSLLFFWTDSILVRGLRWCFLCFFQYDAGRLRDPARAGVRQPAGVRLQDGVHQPAGSPLRGENSEETTAEV